jgi:hypothetical protein
MLEMSTQRTMAALPRTRYSKPHRQTHQHAAVAPHRQARQRAPASTRRVSTGVHLRLLAGSVTSNAASSVAPTTGWCPENLCNLPYYRFPNQVPIGAAEPDSRSTASLTWSPTPGQGTLRGPLTPCLLVSQRDGSGTGGTRSTPWPLQCLTTAVAQKSNFDFFN